MSPRESSVPILTALRLPGIGVCVQVTRGANSSQTCTSPALGAPLMTTMISPGRCSTMRPMTSRKRSSGSSTTGTTTLVVPVNVPVYGRYRAEITTLAIQRSQMIAEYTVNK